MGESLEHPIFTMQEFFELHEELLRLTQHHDIVTISWHLRHADWFCAFTLQPIEPPSRHRSEWDLSCTMRRPTWIVMNRHLHYISRAKHLQLELLLTKLSTKGSGGVPHLGWFSARGCARWNGRLHGDAACAWHRMTDTCSNRWLRSWAGPQLVGWELCGRSSRCLRSIRATCSCKAQFDAWHCMPSHTAQVVIPPPASCCHIPQDPTLPGWAKSLSMGAKLDYRLKNTGWQMLTVKISMRFLCIETWDSGELYNFNVNM